MKQNLVAYVGQHIECKMCSECCHLNLIPLSLDDIERIRMLGLEDSVEYSMSLNRMVLSHREWDAGCVFLDDHKCKIHAHKPVVCRLYPLAIYESPIKDSDNCRYELPDGSHIFLYVDASCPGVDCSRVEKVPEWVLPMVQSIRLNMHITRNFYEGTLSK